LAPHVTDELRQFEGMLRERLARVWPVQLPMDEIALPAQTPSVWRGTLHALSLSSGD